MKASSLILGVGVVGTITGIALLVTFLQGPASAQQNTVAGSSPDIIGDWDFSGMTAEERNAALHLLFPEQYIEQWRKSRTPEQLAAEALSHLAATDAEAYRRLVPLEQTPEQAAREKADAWAISHPVELANMLAATMTKDQLDAAAANAWAITHPAEASKLAAASRTPEEEAQLAAAIASIRQPVLKPKPVPKPGRTHEF